MRVKVIKKVCLNIIEYQALDDGSIITSRGDHPSFGLKSLEDMHLFIHKGETFQLPDEYLVKNSLDIL